MGSEAHDLVPAFPGVLKNKNRGNSRGAFGRKNLQDLKKAFFVLSTRKTQFLVTKTLKILNWEGS